MCKCNLLGLDFFGDGGYVMCMYCLCVCVIVCLYTRSWFILVISSSLLSVDWMHCWNQWEPSFRHHRTRHLSRLPTHQLTLSVSVTVSVCLSLCLFVCLSVW